MKQLPTGSETVMLVEDEPAILNMGRGMLEKLGYTVLTAGKPDEALRLAEEHDGKIHLLITDVVMPGMNGRELSAKLSDCRPGLKPFTSRVYVQCHRSPRGTRRGRVFHSRALFNSGSGGKCSRGD